MLIKYTPTFIDRLFSDTEKNIELRVYKNNEKNVHQLENSRVLFSWSSGSVRS